MSAILVVDDEPKLLEVLTVALETMGHEVLTAESAEEALEVLRDAEVHLILTDLRLPGMSGRDLLERVKALKPGLPVVIMTAYASLKDAVDIIKEGAFDYTVKPFDLNDLEATVTSALRFNALGTENRNLRRSLQREFDPAQFVGQSAAFAAMLREIQAVSSSSANVLITGESGTGKELAAKAIHYGGPRASGPLVTINCAAIPESLLESELFGHVRGAFTGAVANRPGRFAMADTGTLFLDEIGDMPLPLQAKVLRSIQEKTVEPVGGGKPRKIDVRIIAATNQDLEKAVASGAFRQDLYYRLNVFPLFMPPLRQRTEDIPMLAAYFAARLAKDMGRLPVAFSAEAMRALQDYPWPGNVRELENCVERLSIISGDRELSKQDIVDVLPALGRVPSPAGPGFPLDLDRTLAEMERGLVLKALEQTGGVQVKAAELLGISERSMWHRIKKLGITVEGGRHFR